MRQWVIHVSFRQPISRGSPHTLLPEGGSDKGNRSCPFLQQGLSLTMRCEMENGSKSYGFHHPLVHESLNSPHVDLFRSLNLH